MLKVCKTCGQEFNCKPSHYDKKTYCSKACMAEDYKTRLKGECNPNYHGVAEERICPCGATFTVGSKGVIGKYCSRSCSAKYRPGNIARLRAQAPKANRAANIAKRANSKKYVCVVCGDPVTKDRKYCSNCTRYRLHARDRKDHNHDEIAQGLVKQGATIIDTHHVGDGFPDLIVGYQGKNYFMEIKNPATKHSLTPSQVNFHKKWPGQVVVVRTLQDALDAIEKATT